MRQGGQAKEDRGDLGSGGHLVGDHEEDDGEGEEGSDAEGDFLGVLPRGRVGSEESDHRHLGRAHSTTPRLPLRLIGEENVRR